MTGGSGSGEDRLSIRGLRAVGHHGVFAAEREQGQEFVVDVTLGVDSRGAAEADDLAHTVDYGTLAERLSAAVQGDPVDLIETLAARLADVCLAVDRVVWVEVTVHKPAAPLLAVVDDVSLSIYRSRHD